MTAAGGVVWFENWTVSIIQTFTWLLCSLFEALGFCDTPFKSHRDARDWQRRSLYGWLCKTRTTLTLTDVPLIHN